MRQNKSKSICNPKGFIGWAPNKWTNQTKEWTDGRMDGELSNAQQKKNEKSARGARTNEFNFWMRNVDVDAAHDVCDQHVVAHSFVYGIMVMLDHRLRNLVALDFDRCHSALAVGDPNEHVHGDGHGYKLIVLLLNRRRRYCSWVRSLRSPSLTFADRRSAHHSADPVNSNMSVSIACPPRTLSSVAIYASQMYTHGQFRRQPATSPVCRSAWTVHRPTRKKKSKNKWSSDEYL